MTREGRTRRMLDLSHERQRRRAAEEPAAGVTALIPGYSWQGGGSVPFLVE